MAISYPISFKNNLYCCKCGTKGKMVYEQSDGKTFLTLPIYPTSKVLCTACNTKYFIKWIWDEDDQDFNPYAFAFDISEFVNDIKKENNQYKRNLDFT